MQKNNVKLWNVTKDKNSGNHTAVKKNRHELVRQRNTKQLYGYVFFFTKIKIHDPAYTYTQFPKTVAVNLHL